jgi:serine/threonine-protein kinase
MGVVYEGFDPTLGRRVAVKTILKSVAIDAETAAAYSARFVREAQAVARLSHPHIVQVHDFGEQDEVAYLVMEFIEGRDLRSFFEAREKFQLADAVRVMAELLDALDFAHERGVIHRDVKPANVLLDPRRRVKLADFGVARVQEGERSSAGTMVGTPAFMSPEQIKGAKIDGRTDIFSAGTILYQLLTGEHPFTGEGAWTVAKKIVEEDPPPPSRVVASVSPAFDAVVKKALAKEPAQRFATAREFAAALGSALAGKAPVGPVPAPQGKGRGIAKGSEAEVEFWRSIQNSDDPDEFEVYLQEFPAGTYAQLARIKIAKLREPLERAHKEAAEKARREAAEDAKRKAEERERREAEERARREAEERARRKAEEEARREAEERARQAALEKARREAAEKAKREAEEKARREHEVSKLAEVRARETARVAAAPADEDATVAIGKAPAPARRSLAVPAMVATAVIGAAVAAYVLLKQTPAPAPVSVAVKPAPPAPEAPAPDIEKIKRETEERVRREDAEKFGAERAAAEKAAAEKAAAEKQAAAKAAAEKAATEKAAAEKAAQEKATALRAAAEKAAAEKAAAERLPAERAAALERAVAEKAAAERAAAERAAAEKAAAEKLVAEKAATQKAAAARAPVSPALPGPNATYRYVWIERQYTRRQEFTIRVTAVDRWNVSESLGATGAPGSASVVDARESRFAVRTLARGDSFLEFAPYLLAQAARELPPLSSASNYPADHHGPWTITGRSLDWEQVVVPAGTYRALRIELSGSRVLPGVVPSQAGNLSARFTYTAWYSPDVKRYVKARHQLWNGRNMPFGDEHVELLEYGAN